MRARYRSPLGTGHLSLDDDVTVRVLFEILRAETGIEHFTIKYGLPMAMKTITLDQATEKAQSLGIKGETLTIVPVDDGGTVTRSSAGDHKNDTDEAIVPWPEREGSLLLRIMPSDNSCLFTAFGGALPQQIPAVSLRKMMADYVREHSDVFNEAILGSAPAEYARSIQDMDRWGGGIELSILSSIFNIQICTFDVQAETLINFGEDKRDRCILVYSGIHYDRVAFSYSEPPHGTVTLPPETDRTIWGTEDSDILEKARVLVKELNGKHYYTDTEALVLKCNEIGCDWIGNGQVAAKKHAEQTGHVDLVELPDTDADNALRRCEAPNCSFMGQGDKAVELHRQDTGHKNFSLIPDIQ